MIESHCASPNADSFSRSSVHQSATTIDREKNRVATERLASGPVSCFCPLQGGQVQGIPGQVQGVPEHSLNLELIAPAIVSTEAYLLSEVTSLNLQLLYLYAHAIWWERALSNSPQGVSHFGAVSTVPPANLSWVDSRTITLLSQLELYRQLCVSDTVRAVETARVAEPVRVAEAARTEEPSGMGIRTTNAQAGTRRNTNSAAQDTLTTSEELDEGSEPAPRAPSTARVSGTARALRALDTTQGLGTTLAIRRSQTSGTIQAGGRGRGRTLATNAVAPRSKRRRRFSRHDKTPFTQLELDQINAALRKSRATNQPVDRAALKHVSDTHGQAALESRLHRLKHGHAQFRVGARTRAEFTKEELDELRAVIARRGFKQFSTKLVRAECPLTRLRHPDRSILKQLARLRKSNQRNPTGR